MPRVDLIKQSPVPASSRARQLEGMFDVPRSEYSTVEWHGDVPIDDESWNVGLIVGPSGAGKSSVARQLFGDAVDRGYDWREDSVIDDFAPRLSMQDIAEVCQAVGFNTIPAWLRPYHVLSTGERFRVELARRLIEDDGLLVFDEFTSVVDRQVAQIGAHAAQKYIRRHNRQFVGVSCHYDIIDWLQPDWILDMPAMTLERRSLRRRPELDITISPVPYATWHTFAPFHYLTRELHRAAQCYALFVGDRIASFMAVLHRPHAKVRDIKGISRIVTLPDWQGLGLAFVLADTLGAAYKALGYRLHFYPAHPPFIRNVDKSPKWAMKKRPGVYGSWGRTHNDSADHTRIRDSWGNGGRPCAVFEYVGAAMDRLDAARLIGAD